MRSWGPVHIATKLKIQSECFMVFLHGFPHEKFPGSFHRSHVFSIIFIIVSMVFPSFSMGFPMVFPWKIPWFSHLQDAQPRWGAELRLSLSSPGRFAENLELSESGSLGTLARPGDGKMGCWRYSVCIYYIYREIDRDIDRLDWIGLD